MVAVMVTAMMAVVAGPAFATVHPLSNAECADDSASVTARDQNPPGISGKKGEGAEHSNADNFAQPVFSASGGDPFSAERPSPAFKTFGTTIPELDVFHCPANK
jgi:hypothetical protein